MAGLGYFIRRCGGDCSIVKVLPDGGEEILETGLTLVEAETLYFVCIGEPVWEDDQASLPLGEPDARPKVGRPRQLALKF